MEICERKKKELEQLKNYYTEKYESLKRCQRGVLHCKTIISKSIKFKKIDKPQSL